MPDPLLATGSCSVSKRWLGICSIVEPSSIGWRAFRVACESVAATEDLSLLLNRKGSGLCRFEHRRIFPPQL